ncbi:hypothetical protein B712_1075 [Chlamydia psittaci NJ1]|nr:hypothetical protein B712_1075 [Chlamydia psittaci NJ1]
MVLCYNKGAIVKERTIKRNKNRGNGLYFMGEINKLLCKHKK